MEILSREEKQSVSLKKLTDEQKKAAVDEIKELNQWYATSKNDLEQKLRQEGKWKTVGLDTNQKYFEDIIKEYRTRFKEIQKRYGII